MVVITSFGHCNVRWYCRRSRGLQTKKLSGANSLIDARRLKVGRTLITTKPGEAVDRLEDCLCVEIFLLQFVRITRRGRFQAQTSSKPTCKPVSKAPKQKHDRGGKVPIWATMYDNTGHDRRCDVVALLWHLSPLCAEQEDKR